MNILLEEQQGLLLRARVTHEVADLLLGDRPLVLQGGELLLEGSQRGLERGEGVRTVLLLQVQLGAYQLPPTHNLVVQMSELLDYVGAHHLQVLVVLFVQTVKLELLMLMPRLHLLQALLKLAKVVNE